MTKVSLIVATLVLILVLALFAFVSDAPAYAGTAPGTCDNCHVMDGAYENWYHASHERWTKCVDCHLPHDNLIHYYFEKGETGFHDVYVFTTGTTPTLIRAKEDTQKIIQANCIRCHNDTVENIVMGAQAFDRHCWDCHRTVAHGPRGTSENPYQDAVIYPVEQGE